MILWLPDGYCGFMLKVGLTGGIAAGKSLVSARLRERGAEVVDADALAREVVAPGTAGLAEVVETFGAGILDPDSSLNRPALGARIFGDEAARAALNAIIHPRVRARAEELVGAAPRESVVVQDIPLLVETGQAADFQLVIVVDASEDVRVQRMLTHRALTEADAHARIRAQATPAQRRAAADVLLDNSGTPEQCLAAVDELWDRRLVPFNDHLLAAKAAPWDRFTRVGREGEDRELVIRRLSDRIRRAAAQVVSVTPFAVGAGAAMAPPDVIALDAVLARGADADAIAEQLARAGFLPVSEGVFGNADPGQPAALRLRSE